MISTQPERWYVYALKCPSTGAVRYVGKSKNPHKRLAAHRSSSASLGMREWVAGLKGDPAIDVLAQADDELSAAILEQSWVAKLTALGASLLNRGHVPDLRVSARSRKHRFEGIGERLKERRQSIGLKQRELARKAGIDQGVVSRLEKGERLNLSAECAVLMARALGCTTEWLVAGERLSPEAS